MTNAHDQHIRDAADRPNMQIESSTIYEVIQLASYTGVWVATEAIINAGLVLGVVTMP